MNKKKLKVKGKPTCPMCGNTLNHVYDDAKEGHTSGKCHRCKTVWIVNLATLRVVLAQ